MYEENENRIDWTNIIKKIIYVLIAILVIFGMISLISRCSRSNSNVENKEEEISLKSQLDEFEGATIKYLNKDNLPTDLNSSKTIRLKLLINKELTNDIKYGNNKVCDINESYAEVTRLENNYAVKLSLTCGTKKDYRVIYVGCFDECNGTVCKGNENSKGVCTIAPVEEPKKEETKPSTTKPAATSTSTNKKPVANNTNNNTTNKEVLYEFRKCTYTCNVGNLTSLNKCSVTRMPITTYESYTNSSIPFKNQRDNIAYEFSGYANGQYNYTKYTCASDEKYDYQVKRCVRYTDAEKTCSTIWSKYTELDGWTRTGNTK